MKTRLIFLVLLIACYSCGTNNKPVSDAQKEKIKGEIKEVVNTFIKGCEELNFDMAIEPFNDSPDFVYIGNGKTYSYKELMAMKPLFVKLLNQKITIVDEKYAFHDNSTVLYTTNCKWLLNYKDGHSRLEDPESFMFMFKKIDSKWKVIYWVDSWVEKNVPSESSKELKQVELMKQIIGTWKAEIDKDTTFVMEIKSYGNGLESYIKTETKGKIIMEAKSLFGYDKNNDRFIESQIERSSPDILLYSMWFTSANKAEEILLEEISNPEKATIKWKYELKSPNLLIATYMQNNKVVAVYTFTRIKK